jgi:hypothetical protein
VTDPLFDRPIFILSSPRSGSTLLFETMAQAPDLFTIGGESHLLIEQVPGLAPRDRGFDSNVLTEADASPQTVNLLRSRFWAGLHDRAGRPPTKNRIRMLEKTPKNALRIRFLQSVFPEARFVFLYRDARQTLGSMIDAWKSGRFKTYPGLPGWPAQQPWSLLLVPGWRDLITQPLHHVVRVQWERTLNHILDQLEPLPRERWTALDYDDFLKDPTTEMQRICSALDLNWDRKLSQALPLSRYTLTRPEPDKWRRHAELIEPLMPELAPIIERARRAVKSGTMPVLL